ncbi:MAG: ATP-binding cassette domain-containing protein [bacterium]|nr:ATP-binding cassette domain-containing protein [bacterium]
MIQIDKLSKYYGYVKAVDDITFSVNKGEIVGFLGPNGAGKTTTMKVITCYMLPSSGKVTVDNLDVVEHSLEVRKKIGYMPESAPLYTDLNVVEYLKLVAELRGVPKEKRNQRAKQMIEVCALGEMIHKRVGALSKGYRQRLCLAQALIHDPEILILDEPTVGLDPNQIIEIRSLIKELGREKTVILSTHILSEVESTCGRIIIINRGKIVADGRTEDIVAGFSGSSLITMEFALPTPEATIAIRNLDRVASVREIGYVAGGGWQIRIETRDNIDLRYDLFRMAAENQWHLLELHRESASLEEVFQILTKENAESSLN